MREAVRNYAAYREGPDSWALGRFVVPATRLEELAEAWPAAGWRLSVLGSGAESAQVVVERLQGAVVEAVEIRATEVAEIERYAARTPAGVDFFFEIPIGGDLQPLVAAIARVGAKAKVRTGGVTPDAFPTAPELARFLRACASARVAFKATAGLHHPLRGTYRLTYEARSAAADMFGFVNVLLAAAFARAGLAERAIVEVLEERDAASIRCMSDGVQWRGHHLSADALADCRHSFALSFGSCSFREPVDELRALRLL
jgi:hypothetical protein